MSQGGAHLPDSWPPPVARVAAFLRDAGAEARLEELESEGATATDAATAIGCRLAQIVKTLVLVCDGAPVAVLVPGDRRVDARKVAQAAGARRARIASLDAVTELTGFQPGGVAPFPLAGVERVLVDESLLFERVVWAGAGTTRHMVSLAPAELLRLTRGEALDVAEPPQA